MGFIRNIIRTLRVTKRPDQKTYNASLRVVALGLSILGALGYVFQLAGSALRMVTVSPISGDILVVVLAAVAAITLAIVLYLRRRY